MWSTWESKGKAEYSRFPEQHVEYLLFKNIKREIANLLLAMYSKFGQERKQQASRATPTCSKSVNSVKPMEGNNTFQMQPNVIN